MHEMCPGEFFAVEGARHMPPMRNRKLQRRPRVQWVFVMPHRTLRQAERIQGVRSVHPGNVRGGQWFKYVLRMRPRDV